MSRPRRIQLRRTRGWRMPPNTVKVDRSTRWGNPFVVGKHGTRAECVDLFGLLVVNGRVNANMRNAEQQVMYLGRVQERIGELRGKNLACWCPPDAPCHADVLLEIANAPQP